MPWEPSWVPYMALPYITYPHVTQPTYRPTSRTNTTPTTHCYETRLNKPLLPERAQQKEPIITARCTVQSALRVRAVPGLDLTHRHSNLVSLGVPDGSARSVAKRSSEARQEVTKRSPRGHPESGQKWSKVVIINLRN